MALVATNWSGALIVMDCNSDLWVVSNVNHGLKKQEQSIVSCGMQLLQLIDLYSRICEIYDKQLILECFRHTENGVEPKFTDQELLTCYLWGVGWEKQMEITSIHRFIATHLADWFPDLPTYQSFNRRLNRLNDCWPKLLTHLFSSWQNARPSLTTQQLLTDSFPVVLAGGRRKPRVAKGLSDKGYCPMKNLYFHGVKVHITS